MLGGRVGTAVVDEVVPAFFSLLAAAVVEFEEDMVFEIDWLVVIEGVLVLVRGCLQRLDVYICLASKYLLLTLLWPVYTLYAMCLCRYDFWFDS